MIKRLCERDCNDLIGGIKGSGGFLMLLDIDRVTNDIVYGIDTWSFPFFQSNVYKLYSNFLQIKSALIVFYFGSLINMDRTCIKLYAKLDYCPLYVYEYS